MPPDPAALLAAMAETWRPAELRRLGPWTLRRGEGAGSRVSAASLDGPDGDIAEAEAAMRAWGQPPLFMIRPGDAALDTTLAARGYALHDPVVIMAAPAAALAPAAPDPEITLGPLPLAIMVELWTAGGIGPSRRAVMARIPAPRTYLLGRTSDRPAGCGFAAGHNGIVMLHALEVAPQARHKSVGRALTRAAAGWAVEIGAETLALAVTEANTPARALYSSLGMTEATRYHYRAIT